MNERESEFLESPEVASAQLGFAEIMQYGRLFTDIKIPIKANQYGMFIPTEVGRFTIPGDSVYCGRAGYNNFRNFDPFRVPSPKSYSELTASFVSSNKPIMIVDIKRGYENRTVKPQTIIFGTLDKGIPEDAITLFNGSKENFQVVDSQNLLVQRVGHFMAAEVHLRAAKNYYTLN
jgi:hypothetical protein